MQELKELLDSNLSHATFAPLFAENISPNQLHEIFHRKGWPNDEVFDARRAIPNVSEESLNELTSYLRSLLNNLVDPNEDSVGLAFPAGYGSKEVPPIQGDGLAPIATVLPVRTLAESLIKGSAILGTERVTQLISTWIQGEPVRYKTIGLLNTFPVQEPLVIEEGLCIDNLPLASDKLPPHLPRLIGMSAENYLGRTVMSIDCEASPAFFHPQENQSKSNVRVASKLSVDIVTFCQALSLGSNSYVDVGHYWNDYQELGAFFFTNEGVSWSPLDARIKRRGYHFSLTTSESTGVKTVRPLGGRQMLEVQPAQVSQICKGLQCKDAKKITLSLARWIASKDFEKSQVDQYIDLRIALESLYLQDFLNEQSQEMRFRLALFGAWHLGSDFEERKKIRRTLRDAYDTASGAVHGGDLEYTPENKELLSDAQDLCRQGILKMLREGYPSQEQWGDLILGIENDEQ